MMTEYRMPDEPDGPVWDRYKDPWVKSYVHFGKWVPGTAPYAVVDEGIPATWDDLLCDLGPLTTTIANEKDEKMTEYRLPKELEDGPLWNSRGDMWTRFNSDMWVHDESGIVSSWLALLVNHGPLTDTPPIKEGDTGLTAEQVWDLPKGSVIWPERDAVPEPWLRFSNRWESVSDVAYGAGELQRACGDSFRVLILGGEK